MRPSIRQSDPGSRWRKILVAAVCVSGIALPLSYPSLSHALNWIGPPPKLSWRVEQSEVIALGRVGRRENIVLAGSDSVSSHGGVKVYSRYSFVVIEAWKGDAHPGDTLTFAKHGGELPGGLWTGVGGDPQVTEGETLVLFLERGTEGFWKNEMSFCWFDGYVRIEDGRGYGYHCSGKSIVWLRKAVLTAVPSPADATESQR